MSANEKVTKTLIFRYLKTCSERVVFAFLILMGWSQAWADMVECFAVTDIEDGRYVGYKSPEFSLIGGAEYSNMLSGYFRKFISQNNDIEEEEINALPCEPRLRVKDWRIGEGKWESVEWLPSNQEIQEALRIDSASTDSDSPQTHFYCYAEIVKDENVMVFSEISKIPSKETDVSSFCREEFASYLRGKGLSIRQSRNFNTGKMGDNVFVVDGKHEEALRKNLYDFYARQKFFKGDTELTRWQPPQSLVAQYDKQLGSSGLPPSPPATAIVISDEDGGKAEAQKQERAAAIAKAKREQEARQRQANLEAERRKAELEEKAKRDRNDALIRCYGSVEAAQNANYTCQ